MRRHLTADFSLYFFRDRLRLPCFWWSCFKMRFLFPFSYPGPQTCVSRLELETHRKTWTAPNNFFKNTKESGKIFKPTTTGKDKIAVETLKSFSNGITQVIIYSKVFKHFIQNSWFNETLLFRLWGLGMDLKFTHSNPCLPLQGLVFFPIQMLGGGTKAEIFYLFAVWLLKLGFTTLSTLCLLWADLFPWFLCRFDQLIEYGQRMVASNPRVRQLKDRVAALKKEKAALKDTWVERNEALNEGQDLQVSCSVLNWSNFM